ncbi:hypothetical protein PV04_04567 [Phialophora macrospora]|uniref:Uncharacterized protein n=1 Tax=Phialophora macrospora TaxID=1851006 RepID=A0A0D2FKJ1_9EURO|nr:hypothetical protein PV04_04567 [Phialophora macrospora]
MPPTHQNTTLSASSGSRSGISSSQQIIEDKYVDPDALKAYMKTNFEPGTWKVQSKLGKFIITTPAAIPQVSTAFRSRAGTGWADVTDVQTLSYRKISLSSLCRARHDEDEDEVEVEVVLYFRARPSGCSFQKKKGKERKKDRVLRLERDLCIVHT